MREHHDFDPLRFIPATPQTEQGYGAYLGSQLSEPRVLILVADRGGTVIGYTHAGLEDTDYMALRGPVGALHDIVVDPDARLRGVGRALLDATLRELAAMGAPRGVLSTAAQN